MIRLACLRGGQELKNKLKLALGKLVLGEPPGILYSLLYRPKFFGKAMGPLHNAVVRGPSDWTIAERELFSAFVSSKNSCRFCLDAHSAIADRAFGHPVVDLVMSDRNQAPISDKAKAMLGFLDKLTVAPDKVVSADIDALRAAGIGEQAIADGIYVCALFSVFNRIVFATGVEPMTPKQLNAVSFVLLKAGYDL